MRAKKALGKVVMLQVCFVLILISQANAIPVDVNIYSSTTIDSGEYGTVNIYDTPPDQTIVDMTGGDVEYCNLYDTTNLDFNGGEILLVSTYNNSKATINVSTNGVFELYNNSQIHLHDGGLSNSIFIYDDAELHIYGYNLYYDEIPAPNWVDGYWASGQEFRIILRNIYSYNPEQIFLHEIPEPISILLFAFGGLLLRRIR